ncbi:sirohydrochlorin chelatase [Effusibacillus pohliae]|uniref:sirohydrochlorin chelatase n=1 Tax=Effusibacillus pohliae TaxID=232270 RepID=UPI00037E9AE6|nr:CbiX/SirB N-terminal domain-containing protein [Effusibacillus pohliae]
MQGILLIGHGSSVAEANRGLHRLAEEIRRRREIGVVEVAFLNLCPPDIPTAVLTCVKKGVTHLNVIPYFLTDGVLLRKAERIVREEVENFRGMTMSFGRPIGVDRRIVGVLKDRIQSALAQGSD